MRVIGTQRDPEPIAAFCLQGQAIVHVDLARAHIVRFVNGSVDQLVSSLAAVVEMWPTVVASDEGLPLWATD